MAYKLTSPEYISVGQLLYKKIDNVWRLVGTDIRGGTANNNVNIVPRTRDKARIVELPKGWKAK